MGKTYGKRSRPRGPTPRAQPRQPSPAVPPRRRAPRWFYWVYEFKQARCPYFPVLYYRDLETSAYLERVLALAHYRADKLRYILYLRGRAYYQVAPTVSTEVSVPPPCPPRRRLTTIVEGSPLQCQAKLSNPVPGTKVMEKKIRADVPSAEDGRSRSSSPPGTNLVYTLPLVDAVAIPAAHVGAPRASHWPASSPALPQRARPRIGESLRSFRLRLSGAVGDQWLPLVYRQEVTFFDVCQYCGARRETARGQPWHTDITNCPVRQVDLRMLQLAQGLSKAQVKRLPICEYAFCQEPASHRTVVCKTLAHWCRDCSLRGCNGVCPVGESEVLQRRLAFEAKAGQHIYARRGRGWGQQGPYIPLDKLVFVRSHPEKRGLFVVPPGRDPTRMSAAELALLVEEGLRP